jgi:uncharacterized protein YcbX
MIAAAPASVPIVRLVGLWRYPVKSMQGEALESAELVPVGLSGDRRYGVRADESGRILSAKREGRLLTARATRPDALEIALPNGEILDGLGSATDAALSAWLSRPVRLVEAQPEDVATFESQSDMADDDSASVTWEGPAGAFVDSSPVHLITTASLRFMQAQRPDLDWDIARFRPNLVLDVPGSERIEDDWVGRLASVGEVQLEIIKRCERCVMVTRPQPGGLDRQLGVLTHLSRVAESTFGVLARVVRPGRVTVNNQFTLDWSSP